MARIAHMANPNPSPGTRFKAGQAANPGGKTKKQKAQEVKAASLSADLRLKMLSRMLEMVNQGQDVFELIDANTLRLFKDSEDRAHGTPKATTEMSGVDGGAIQTEEIGNGAAKVLAVLDTIAERAAPTE